MVRDKDSIMKFLVKLTWIIFILLLSDKFTPPVVIQ